VDYLERLVGELDLEGSVRFRGPVERSALPRHYQSADIFCFPTLADTYGVALLEAMSSGCPVVASDTGGPGELVRDDRGIRVPLTTPERYVEEFAAALVALASNADLRSRLGANARRYAVQEHDWHRLGERLLDIYETFTAGLDLGVAQAAG
jgi:glycosyltransferase involved in cell wall biosynthesis